MDLNEEHDEDDFPPAYRELLEPSQPTPKAMRAWALERGFVVGARGPVPVEVRRAYEEAAQS